MFRFSKFLPIFFLVNCFFSYAHVIHERHELEESEVKAYSSKVAISPNGKHIFYVACNEVGAKNKKLSDTDTKNEEDGFAHGELVCDLKLETPSFAGGSYVRSCNDVQLLPRSHNVTLDRLTPLYLIFISETKVAIRYVPTYFSPSKTYFKIFDLATCTTTADFHFSFSPGNNKMFWQYLVPHDNYLEFFTLDDELCGNMGQCRVNYTFYGEMIGEPKQLPHFFARYVFKVNDLMPQKGYYLFGTKTTSASRYNFPDFKSVYVFVSYFDPLGKETELMRQNCTLGYFGQASFTNSHELLSGCWVVLIPGTNGHPPFRRNVRHDTIQCVQFDVTGMKANVSLNMDNPTAGMAVHTSSNGEMILATADVKVDNSSIAHIESFHLYKIGSNGSSGQSLLVRDLNHKLSIGLDYVEMAITKNLNDELCVHIAVLGQNLNYPVPRINIEDSQYVQKCVPSNLLNNL